MSSSWMLRRRLKSWFRAKMAIDASEIDFYRGPHAWLLAMQEPRETFTMSDDTILAALKVTLEKLREGKPAAEQAAA